MVKGDNFIHVRLDYEEVVNSKKDILASEIDTINIMKSMGRYIFLRQKELDLKSQFYREIKKMVINLKLLETSLPQIKVPKMLLPEVEKQSPVKGKMASLDENGLEGQLREIQRKLRAISY